MNEPIQDHQILEILSNRTREIQKEFGLIHLSEIEFNGQNPLTRFHEVVGRHKAIKSVPIFLYDDLFFICNDLMFFTSQLFLFRPFINNPSREMATYFQNWHDARFLSFIGILHNGIYNFWDRIGDLIYCFFPTGIDENRVYVGKVLNNIPDHVKNSDYYKRLEDLFKRCVHPIIQDRNRDAHNESIPTTHFFGLLMTKGSSQKEKFDLKQSSPEYFSGQIKNAYLGLELSLLLIEDKADQM